METKPTSHIMKGLIISLVMIIFGLVLYFTGQSQNKALSWLQFVILVAGIAYSCILYAKQMDGNVTFGQDFAHGFKTTAVIIVIFAVWTFISMKFIFPDMVDKAIETARAEYEKQGKLSDEQISQALEIIRKFAAIGAVAGIIFMFGIIGAIASVIGADVAKKNPQPQNPFGQ
jgi:formate hydrogenlyase subunit 3/multisubunit Na+/H+ antiporter MnhD subunit